MLQAYAQYATGNWTIIGGKFVTLAGAEVIAPTGNTNFSRSLLFAYEPSVHHEATSSINAAGSSRQMALFCSWCRSWRGCYRLRTGAVRSQGSPSANAKCWN